MPPLARFSTSFTIIIFILLKETRLGEVKFVQGHTAGFEPPG